MLSKKTTNELVEIIRQEYQKDITMAEALKIAEKIGSLYRLLANIYNRTDNEHVEIVWLKNNKN